MNFEYYYGTQSEQFTFIRIPKLILTNETFAGLSLQAKVLYGVLLDRMGLSMKNGWLDEKQRVYIIYQISEIQEDLGFSKKKSMEYLKELEQIGLVEKKRRGLGLPSILYVKSFLSGELAVNGKETPEQSMFALKLIGKLLLLPLWLILLLSWIIVRVAVNIFSLFYGFWKLFWTAVIVLSLCFGLWQNAILMGVFIAAVFLILFAGSFVDVLLETARQGSEKIILR